MLQYSTASVPFPTYASVIISEAPWSGSRRAASANFPRSTGRAALIAPEHEWTGHLAQNGNGGHSGSDASSQRLAAIVESSDDAIIAKDLDGNITDWNAGAERLFGYAAPEIIGKSVMVLIPQDQHDEELIILDRIRTGKRIKHFETIRLHKSGKPVVVSLSISPIRDESGSIIGASKIARDITDRVHSQEQHELLMREMNHRIKNLFAVATSVVSLTAKSSATKSELARTVNERLFALSRAHDLTMPRVKDGRVGFQLALLKELAEICLAPHQRQLPDGKPRILISGPDIHCGPISATAFALLFYEFATNSVKYGALSVEDCQVTLGWTCDDEFHFYWKETGGPLLKSAPNTDGFGSILVQATVKSLKGRINQDWALNGLSITIDSDASYLAF